MSCDGNVESIVDRLVSFAAPKSFFLKKYKHPMSDNANVQIILRKQPEMLLLYGIDPNKLRKELEDCKEKL